MGDSDTTTTTAAPAPAPAGDTTAAPAGETTAAPGHGTTAPGQSTTAAPGGTTTASGAAPTVTGKIAIDPDDGSPQNDGSVQAPVSAKLTLSWSATNATGVNIDGVGDGQPVSGSAPIPTQDGSVTLVAVAADGTQSAPLVIQIATHPDGDVVSGHADLNSGIASVLSFAATKDGQAVTSASVGDAIVLTASVSAATDQVVINGAQADLTDTPDGNKQATASITIAAGMSGDFTCEVSAGGTAGDPGSAHLDIGPAASSSTTTTAAPGNTTTGPASNTTAAFGSTTTHAPSTTTTLAPQASTTASANTTTTHPGSTTTRPGSTTTHPGSTTTAALDDSIFTNEKWLKADGSDGTDQIGHGEAVKLYAETPGVPVGTTVYFSVWQQESGGDWVALAGVTAQVAQDGSGVLSAQADFTTPADSDDSQGSGAASGDGASSDSGSGSADPSAASSSSDGTHCSFGFTPSFKDAGSSGS